MAKRSFSRPSTKVAASSRETNSSQAYDEAVDPTNKQHHVDYNSQGNSSVISIGAQIYYRAIFKSEFARFNSIFWNL
jgi:hypothetical protein